MEVKVIDRDEIRVIGLQVHICADTSAVPALWKSVMERAHEIPSKEEGAYGVVSSFEPTKREFDYLAGLCVTAETEVPPGMQAVTAPAGRYAEARCTLPGLMECLHALLHEWLPTSGYVHAGTAEVEYYGSEFNSSDPGSTMYYYVPITRRA